VGVGKKVVLLVVVEGGVLRLKALRLTSLLPLLPILGVGRWRVERCSGLS